MLCSGLTRPAGRRSAKSRQHRVSPMKGSWPCSPMNIFGNVSAGLEPVGFGLAAKTTTDTDAFSSTSLSTDIFTKHCMGLSFPRRSISTMNAIRQLACIPCTCCESLHKSIYFWETRLTKDLPLERAVIAAMSSQQKIPTSERIKEDAVADNAGAKVSAENRSEAINPWPLSSGNEGLSLPANHGLAFQCSARQSKADTFPNGRFDSGKAQSTRICQWRRNSCLWLRASIALGGQRPPAMGWMGQISLHCTSELAVNTSPQQTSSAMALRFSLLPRNQTRTQSGDPRPDPCRLVAIGPRTGSEHRARTTPVREVRGLRKWHERLDKWHERLDASKDWQALGENQAYKAHCVAQEETKEEQNKSIANREGQGRSSMSHLPESILAAIQRCGERLGKAWAFEGGSQRPWVGASERRFKKISAPEVHKDGFQVVGRSGR